MLPGFSGLGAAIIPRLSFQPAWWHRGMQGCPELPWWWAWPGSLLYPTLLVDSITEWFGVEGTFEDHLVYPASCGQGHFPLDQIAQSPIQPDLEHFQ